MTRLHFAELGDLCTFVGGGTPSRKLPDYFTGDIPWATVKDFKSFTIEDTEEHITEQAVKDSAAHMVERGSVLLVTRVGLGKVAVAGTRLAINQDIKAVKPGADLKPEFLFWFLLSQAKGLQAMGTGATVKGVTLNDVKAIHCPVLPLAEQHRIVNLLSRAEGIVRLRREAQRKAAELIPAIFLDLFGDPATNPKRWSVMPLGDLVEKFEGGKNIQAGDEGASAIRILKISAVTSGHYVESESKPVPADFSPPISYFVRVGDLLFSRANTEALVGATALVEDTDGTTLLPDKLWRFVWCADAEVVPAFILHFLQQPATRKLLSQLASGTGGSMKNISQAKLKTLPVLVPPIDLQHQFAAKAEAVRSIIARQTAALATAQANFAALLHQAFA